MVLTYSAFDDFLHTHVFLVWCAVVTCSLCTHVFVRPFFVDLYLFRGAILSLSGTTSELAMQPSWTLALIGYAIKRLTEPHSVCRHKPVSVRVEARPGECVRQQERDF